MLRAGERVLKGEEWSSEKEAAWSKDFFFIQVLSVDQGECNPQEYKLYCVHFQNMYF